MKNSFVVGALMLLMLSCVSESQKGIEEARFLLDQGEFAQAIALLKPILADEPNNNEAKFLYGSALIGGFALEKKSGCLDTDTGYLGLLACLLDDKTADDSNGLKTFSRIAPENGSSNDEIAEAVDVLVSIESFNERVPEKDVALQRLVARAFAISSVFQVIGANSPNENQCYVGGTGVDEIPDDYDSTLLVTAQAADFRANLEGIQTDAQTVGFDTDFNLITRVNDILDDLDAAGGSTLSSVVTIFDNAYINQPGQQVCN